MAERRFLTRLLLGVWIVAVFSDATAGILRFALASVGLVWVSYLPKALVVAFGIFAIFRKTRSFVQLGSFAILAFAAVIGIANGLRFEQIASAFTLFMPLIFGAECFDNFDRSRSVVVKWLLLVYALSCVGVLLTNFVSVPWSELAYNVGDVAVEGVRSWSYEGFNRPPGFTRSSVAVATILMISTCLLYPVAWNRSKIVAIVLVIVGVGCAVVSTTKGVVAAIVLALLIFSLPRKLYGLATGSFVVLIMVIPLSTVFVRYTLGFDNPFIAFLTLSFDERLTNTWPNGIDIVWRYGIPFMGRGLGGVGTAARYLGDSGGPLASASVMDNFALYMYGHFGLIGIALFVYMARCAVKLIKRADPFDRGLGLCLLALLISGLSMDFIESLPATIVVGMALAAAARRRTKPVINFVPRFAPKPILKGHGA
ncbi:hypothetical protein [Paraburkholderia sediminicola]|uniref:hypothetical protein n=1 Tax=Paraburkholderia sediminicola TaxID=458836 RepID=UPI000EB5A996